MDKTPTELRILVLAELFIRSQEQVAARISGTTAADMVAANVLMFASLAVSTGLSREVLLAALESAWDSAEHAHAASR